MSIASPDSVTALKYFHDDSRYVGDAGVFAVSGFEKNAHQVSDLPLLDSRSFVVPALHGVHAVVDVTFGLFPDTVVRRVEISERGISSARLDAQCLHSSQ